MLDLLMLVPAASFVTTLLLLAIILRIRLFVRIQDVPNERSLHIRPIPRIGGLALLIGAIGAYGILFRQQLWCIEIPILLLMGVSFADDVWDLPAIRRFLAHFAAAVLFTYWGLGYAFVDIGAILIVIAMVWMINLYNFMDGSDGLAGGMAMIGFCVYGVAAALADRNDFAIISFSIAASAIAFLIYNFHPAKVFLGDVGSVPLGFAAGSLGFLGWTKDIWPLWFPLLVFSPFIVDASLTLLKRLFRLERVWEGHREHYYQRMVLMGWGHSKTALIEYGLMVCVGCSALMALQWRSLTQVLLLVGWAVVYLGIAVSLDRGWRRYQATLSNAH
jgi:UDP-N-acetylmuramyl pentapeptide phosphotransferase/UDP-N-acetylglucosamine-1-phosphate transferase